MTSYAQHVGDYLRLRRSLGYKLTSTRVCCVASPLTSTPPTPSS